MLSKPISLTLATARRFQVKALRLDRPFPSVAEAIDYMGYVQIDPINVCGRMHDLILRNRICEYNEGGLHDYLYETNRPGFEQYLPGQGILVAFNEDAWPYLVPKMRELRTADRGYGRKLSPEEAAIACHILKEIEIRGPLSSDQIEHEGEAMTAWGTQGRMVKTVLEKLFIQGRVLISSRRKFRRVYDLPERVITTATLNLPDFSEVEVNRWLIQLRLRQRRLMFLKRKELMLVDDLVQPLRVENCQQLYCLKSDLRLLDGNEEMEDVVGPTLIAPLDPLIYDRKLTSTLWGYDYTWEVYTPALKRQRGYYALPLLNRDELVGYIDPKANRKTSRLEVISKQVKRGHKSAQAVKELAQFLGLKWQ